jgi:RNA polymerase sigma factor (sigma-70 family)
MSDSQAVYSRTLGPRVMTSAKSSLLRPISAEDLFRQYGERILFYLRGLVGDEHAAEDLLQDVFVNLVKSGALKSASINSAFLFRCARNAALNALDDHGRARRAADGWKHWKMALVSGEASGTQTDAGHLTDALQILDEDTRELVLLKTHGELSYSEIAEIIGSSKSTVAERYVKALQKLKAHLDRSGQ